MTMAHVDFQKNLFQKNVEVFEHSNPWTEIVMPMNVVRQIQKPRNVWFVVLYNPLSVSLSTEIDHCYIRMISSVLCLD